MMYDGLGSLHLGFIARFRMVINLDVVSVPRFRISSAHNMRLCQSSIALEVRV